MCDIGIGLTNRSSRLETPNAVAAEGSELEVGSIQRERDQKIEILIDHSKSARHHADDSPRLGIHLDRRGR